MSSLQSLRGDCGSAIIYALYATIFLTVVFSLLVVFALAWQKEFSSSYQLLRARYNLESAIIVAISAKDDDSDHTNTSISLNQMGDSIHVSRELFGGLKRILAHQKTNSLQCFAEAYAASPANNVTDLAVQLNDTDRRLFLSGSTSIDGDVQLNGGSIEFGSIGGRRFEGRLQGPIRDTDHWKAPPDFATFEKTISRLDSIIANQLNPREMGRTNIFLDRPTQINADWFKDGTPVAISSEDPLTLTDTGWIPDGSIIATSSTLTIGTGTMSEFVMYYGRGGIQVGDQRTVKTSNLSGQFLSRFKVQLDSLVSVSYPSFIFVEGPPGIAGINFHPGSRFDGSVVFSSTELTRSPSAPTITIAADALVRGAIFNSGATDLSGTVHGSVITEQFFFYSRPSSYVNWLLDATVDVRSRPKSFVLPLTSGRPTILQLTSECRRV